MLERRADAIGDEEQLEVLRIDRPFSGKVMKQLNQRAPVFGTDQDYGKVFDLPGLNQHQCLEQFVKRAEAAWQPDESVGVLEQENLADKEGVACD